MFRRNGQRMKIFKILLVGFLLCLGAVSIPSQQTKKEEIVVFNGLIEDVQKTDLDEGVADAYITAYYDVLKVCEGDLNVGAIRIAHRLGTTKGFEVGDTVCMRVRRSDELKQFAQDLLEIGFYLPEEDRADYWYAGFNQPCSCEM